MMVSTLFSGNHQSFTWVTEPSIDPFSGLKILLVDDSPMTLRLGEILLQKLGCSVLTANSGEDALTKIDWEIDLVFLDLQMPGWDGYETACRIRQSFPDHHLRIAAYTSLEPYEVQLEPWFDCYIGKPIRLSDMERALRHSLRSSSRN